MKIIAILGLIAILMGFLLQIDEKNGWMTSVKMWIRTKLGMCNHFKQIRFEEEYSKEGEPYYHHTYRVTYCPLCGKVFKREQMQ